jgi:integrase
MGKAIERLTALKVKALVKPGRHGDGGNLYLVVSPSGSKTWSFLYRWRDRQREAGFGSIDAMSLKEARERAREGRSLIKQGQDPIAVWQEAKRAAKTAPTFGEVAAEHFEKKVAEWKSKKAAKAEQALLARYGAPLMKLPVDQIDTSDVKALLKSMWSDKPDVAMRLRQRIEQVLDLARVLGHIDAHKANPARWKGHLDQTLPKRSRDHGHHASLSYAEVPAFVASLRAMGGVLALALEFVILTGVRANEATGARWDEISLSARTWVISAERMKSGREHRAPLSERAIEILKARRAATHEDEPLVFRGPFAPLNAKTFERVIRKLGTKTTVKHNGASEKVWITTHGFRSSLRDWMSEQTATPFAVMERVLAHAVGDGTVQAYDRTDQLEQRRAVMELWGRFLEQRPEPNVVPLAAVRG